MYDEKTENDRNSIGVIKTWVARTGHSLLATKAHKNLLVVLSRGGEVNEEMIVLQMGTIDLPDKSADRMLIFHSLGHGHNRSRKRGEERKRERKKGDRVDWWLKRGGVSEIQDG